MMQCLWRGEKRWVLWIGRRQWKGLPGQFGVGQEGWAYPLLERQDLFIFAPDLGELGFGWYQVSCSGDDFLVLASLENA